MTLHKPVRNIVLTLVAAVVLAACSGISISVGPSPTKDTSTQSFLPNPAGYTIADVASIQDVITRIGQITSAGSGQLEITALVTALNGVTKCYQGAGALEARTYVNNTDPTQAGAVVVVNRNVLTDPSVLLNCTLGRAPSIATTVQICTRKCTINANNNQYYVFYAATNQQVCSAFDQSLNQNACS
ncbi:MAG TPA: hypothetical protein VMT34_09265 [Aggregatilineales bacterium]|nr:hypothetical protein [Aggregatilineales bacterium]